MASLCEAEPSFGGQTKSEMRGRIGKVAAIQMAAVDIFTFQRALSERGVPLYTEQMLASDLQSLNEVFQG